MNLSEAQKLLITKLGKRGLPVTALSKAECREAGILNESGAVIWRWKGLDEGKWAATVKGLAAAATTWEWYAGEDAEFLGAGPCATRQEAIDKAISYGFGFYDDKSNGVLRYKFIVLEAMKEPVNLSSCVDFDRFIESLTERVDENHGDVAEAGSIFDTAQWNTDQERDLQAMVEASVAAWQAKHSIVVEPWLFTATRNQETVKVERPREIEPAE